ncbi:MAG: hypothetical protein PHT60_06825 [Acidiphilium sp.]|nr:hypothetical protein [Acidiphilium sp.]MDD4935476.1 hypothetical protein [Acidiphilium sp.]
MQFFSTDPIIAKRVRGAIMLASGLLIAAALSGCISLGGGSPPSKTYIVVPPGSSATQTPPPPS